MPAAMASQESDSHLGTALAESSDRPLFDQPFFDQTAYNQSFVFSSWRCLHFADERMHEPVDIC